MSLRTTINLNAGWTFTGPAGGPCPVDIPHTWNAIDGQDGGNDYWRGTCLYEKTFPKPEFGADQRVYLEFRGVNASARVALNGSEVGSHDGGYSTFRWDVTDLLQAENRLTVHVDNSRNDRVYPQKADFTFYGGIYRDVLLLIVHKDHFELDYCGGEEEFFREMLRIFYAQGADKRAELAALYESANWPDYAIKVHALKSTSLTIGAEKLSAYAKELELAGKKKDTAYIREHHPILLRQYEELCEHFAGI